MTKIEIKYLLRKMTDANNQNLIDPVLDESGTDEEKRLFNILKGNVKKIEDSQSANVGYQPRKLFKEGFTPPVRFGLKLENKHLRELGKKLSKKYDPEKVMSILMELDQAVEEGIITNDFVYTLFENPELIDKIEERLNSSNKN